MTTENLYQYTKAGGSVLITKTPVAEGDTPSLYRLTAGENKMLKHGSFIAKTVDTDTPSNYTEVEIISSAIAENKSVTLDTAVTATLTPSTGFDAMKSVSVSLEGAEAIVPSNIKKDVEILGVTGTLEEGTPEPSCGVIFSRWNANGLPTKAKIKGYIAVPDNLLRTYQNALCGRIEEIEVTEGTTALGIYCFGNNGNLTSVSLPSTLNVISSNAFFQSGLTSVVIPSSVTAIGQTAFSGSRKLTGIVIPEGVTSIGNGGFLGCALLKTVVFDGELDPSATFRECFKNDNSVELYDFSSYTFVPTLYSAESLGHASGCIIKVPQSLLNAWQAATNWSALSDVVWQGV